MARILITGSSDGLGASAARHFIAKNHRVILHARNASRAEDAMKACPGAEGVVVGDLSSMRETQKLAAEINRVVVGEGGGGKGLDAVIFNAGLYRGPFRQTALEKSEDGSGREVGVGGVPALMAVNTFATYILSCLINPTPTRVVFLSSGLHSGGDGDLRDLDWRERGQGRWSDAQAYADSKLHNIMFAGLFGKLWKEKGRGWEGYANSMDPGWVSTKMGGSSATGSWDAAVQTYEYLATEVETTGGYWTPGKRKSEPIKVANDESKWDELLQKCAEITGVTIEGEIGGKL